MATPRKVPKEITDIREGRKPKENPVPVPPDWFDKAAYDEWWRVVPLLAKWGMAGTLDIPQLESYCVSYSRWKAAEKRLQSEGLTQINSAGTVVSNPLVAISKSYHREMIKSADVLGINLAARSELETRKPQGDLKGIID